MPSSWRTDPRFICPNCRALIYLKSIGDDSPFRSRTRLDIIAACRNCSRAYLVEEWRQRCPLHDPWNDMDF